MTLYTQKGKKKQGKISGYEFVSYLDLIDYCTINIPNGFEAGKSDCLRHQGSGMLPCLITLNMA